MFDAASGGAVRNRPLPGTILARAVRAFALLLCHNLAEQMKRDRFLPIGRLFQ
jgi:hypothetical protein